MFEETNIEVVLKRPNRLMVFPRRDVHGFVNIKMWLAIHRISIFPEVNEPLAMFDTYSKFWWGGGMTYPEGCNLEQFKKLFAKNLAGDGTYLLEENQAYIDNAAQFAFDKSKSVAELNAYYAGKSLYTSKFSPILKYKSALLQTYHLPGMGQKVTNPITHSVGEVWNIIQFLNDVGLWSREQIADWLETLDIDMEFK